MAGRFVQQSSNAATVTSVSQTVFEVLSRGHRFSSDQQPLDSAPCPKQYLNASLAACAGMTLQACYSNSRTTTMFEGTDISKWTLRVTEVYTPEKKEGFPNFFVCR